MEKRWVIFDIDGVLIDVSESFDMAVKKTVEYFSSTDFDLSIECIRDLRKKGLFSDDFELTETLLRGSKKFYSSKKLVDKFKKKRDINWVREKWPNSADQNKIIRVFNSYYLGSLYEESLFDYEGLWKEEKRIVDLKLLKDAKNKFKIGVITGRNRLELRLAEDIIGFEFEEYVTRDDYLKPDPKALEYLIDTGNGFYLGDTSTDKRLVQNYNTRFDGKICFVRINENSRGVNDFLKTILG